MDSTLKSNTKLHFPDFDIISQERKTNKRGGGVLIYIHKNLKCNYAMIYVFLKFNYINIIKINSISIIVFEISIEISRENDKNIFLSCCCST